MEIPNLKVLNCIDNDDGSMTVEFEQSDKFIKWFKEDQNLKRWSQKRFEKWILKALETTLQENNFKKK